MSVSAPTAGQLASRCIDIVNTGRADRAAEVCAPEFVTIDPHGHDHAPEGITQGPEIFANIVGYLHHLFDELHLDITECYDVGDRAATVIQLTGRYLGASENTDQLGRPVAIEQVHFWYASDGKLVQHRFLENDAEFERQVS